MSGILYLPGRGKDISLIQKEGYLYFVLDAWSRTESYMQRLSLPRRHLPIMIPFGRGEKTQFHTHDYIELAYVC